MIDLENEILKLKSEIGIKNHTIEELNKKLEKKQSQELKNSQHELIDLYKPKSKNFVVAGVTALLLLLVNIITNLNSIKDKLSSIIPFETKYINYLLFTILIIVTIHILQQQRKLIKVKDFSEKLISPNSIKEFAEIYKKKFIGSYSFYNKNYFMEADVTEYILQYHIRGKYNKGLLYYFENIFLTKDYKSINYLSNIFIYNLLSKKLIDIGTSKDLEREFIIK